MKQKNARKGEMEAYPCRANLQQLLDQVGELSISANGLQGAGMGGGGGRLRGVGPKSKFSILLRASIAFTILKSSWLTGKEDSMLCRSLALSKEWIHEDPHMKPIPGILLAEDPSLKHFKSHKKGVWQLKRFGDVLTIIVVAGSGCYWKHYFVANSFH
ncbi:hypothetical protein LOK49_LG05G02048 [Camellia lanceoleosa]|uniref:Uncharacterized protein n=1 Tax=Camellia lanceoleosa TaxID=1840588 RepID=A0ACC0HQY3_9ERIC|nr:hypothetical protein LOK49_LG05G02048 [Camellia lanceoleosa]